MSFNKRKKLKKLFLLTNLQLKYIKLLKLRQNKKRKRIWRQHIYTERERDLRGFFTKLFLYIKTKNEAEFRKATRMGVTTFKVLSNFLKEKLTKEDYIRESIPAEFRLALTLVYLGQGVCRQMLAWSFRVGVSTVAKIIYETCTLIWDELRFSYLKPLNKEEWEHVATQFRINTGMPNVIGAIDGKHIAIKCPPYSGSQYYNYKQFFSIVLLAVCDSEYNFTAVDIGAYGSQSDGGILQDSKFGKKIMDNSIHPLEAANLPNSDIIVPYYFIGDAAFPLKPNLMRPYPGRNLPADKEYFNKRLSRARVRIENTFGIYASKWRILNNKLDMLPKNAEKIVKATVILHNFVNFHESTQYCPRNYVDQYREDGDMVEGLWRREVDPLQQISIQRFPNSSRIAFGIRDTLKDYLFDNAF